MTVQAVVVHQLPSRVRLLFAAQRGDGGFFGDLAKAFSDMPAVRRVKANPLAASVTVEATPDVAHFLQQAEQQGLFVVVQQDVAAKAPTKPLHIVTGKEIDPHFVAGSAYVLMGAVQTLRGRVLVPAISFFWYAWDVFNRPGTTR